MRAKRAKQYRKLMKAYELSFNFREPYQVLLDAQFIRDAHRYKMHLGKMLENTLSGVIKPMITQCCIRHLYDIKPADDAEQKEKEICIEVAKAAERRRCGHHELEEPLSEVECLKSVVDPKGSGTNRHRYVVASQDRELRASMRDIAGVPLIYINRSVMILEPMAEKTEDVREKEERGKVRAGLKSRRGAQPELKRKREDGDDEQYTATTASGAGVQAPERKKQKARGPKAPNPLSVKKAKAKPNSKPAAPEISTKTLPTKKAFQPTQNATTTEPSASRTAENGVVDGTKKRKRKRKPKEVAQEGGHESGHEED